MTYKLSNVLGSTEKIVPILFPKFYKVAIKILYKLSKIWR